MRHINKHWVYRRMKGILKVENLLNYKVKNGVFEREKSLA